jgi:HEPN domain-containing protein
MPEPYEEGKRFFKEGLKFKERAKLLLNNADYVGSVHASQNAVEFFIKSAYILQGKEPPRNYSLNSDFKEIVKKLREAESPLLTSNVFKQVNSISKRFQGLHGKSMYGEVGKTASQLFTKKDAIEYFHLANEMGLLMITIDVVYSGHADLLPKEKNEFFDKHIEKRKT